MASGYYVYSYSLRIKCLYFTKNLPNNNILIIFVDPGFLAKGDEQTILCVSNGIDHCVKP